MKDYASVATQLSITHLMVFSQTENNVILRVARHPDGPTLHFRVQQFMPSKLVKASQKRPYESEAACKLSSSKWLKECDDWCNDVYTL